jgi:signal transduction histidine kinase
MTWTLSLYTICGLVAGSVTAGTLWFVWSARSDPHGPAFVGLLVTASGWAFTYAIQLGYTTVPGQAPWQRLALVLGGTIPTLWFLFSFRFVGEDRWLTRRWTAVLAIEPLAFAVIAFTNGYHGLGWTTSGLTETGYGPVLDLTFGPLYFPHSVYSYLIVAAGLVMLLREFVHASTMYRRQVGLLILGGLPSMLTHVLFTLQAGPITDLDLTPFALSIAALSFGLTIFHFDLLDRSPVARQQAFQRMGDGLLVVDDGGEIVEVNGVAGQVFDPTPVEGRQVGLVLPETDLDELDGRTVTTTVDGTEHTYDCHVTPFYDHHDRLTGRGVVLRDVTERRAYEQRLEVANRILRHNLRNDMTVILGRADELESVVDDTEAVEIIRETVRDIMEVSEKAREMIQHTRFDDLDREPVDVVGMVEHELARYRRAYPDVTWRFAAPMSAAALVAGEESVDSALENLLDNAVEHNDADDPVVTVTVEADDRQIRLTVADNGSGIPELERDVFVSGTETPLKHSQGLGLWLVYWHVTASGGDVSIDVDGDGSVVTLSLPRGDGGSDADDEHPRATERPPQSTPPTR